MYSQQPLLALLRAGNIPGETGVPKHIETVISNVYLFQERAYKVYKNDNVFFNENFHNISDKQERFTFSKADFEWNQRLTKEIYLNVQGVAPGEKSIELVGEQDAEELVFVTKRMPEGTILFDRILKGDLVMDEYYVIGRQFAQREKNFVWNATSDESVLDNMLGRYDDVTAWAGDVTSIPAEEKEMYTKQLRELIIHAYTLDSSQVVRSFDIHSLNAFYLDRIFYPFDTHPPKDAWGFSPPSVNIYRLATDVAALAGEKEFHAVLSGYYEDLGKEMPAQETHRLLIIYAALMMVSYLYMLGKTDSDKQEAAVRYHHFLKNYAVA